MSPLPGSIPPRKGLSWRLGALVTGYFSVIGVTIPGTAEISARFNMPSTIYPQVDAISLTLGPSVVFIFSVLASLYPALRLLRLRPVEAMRAI